MRFHVMSESISLWLGRDRVCLTVGYHPRWMQQDLTWFDFSTNGGRQPEEVLDVNIRLFKGFAVSLTLWRIQRWSGLLLATERVWNRLRGNYVSITQSINRWLWNNFSVRFIGKDE